MEEPLQLAAVVDRGEVMGEPLQLAAIVDRGEAMGEPFQFLADFVAPIDKEYFRMKKWLVSKIYELKLEVEDEEEEDQYEEQELNEEGDREDEGEQEQNEKEDGVNGTVRILDPVSKKRKGRLRSLRIKRCKRTANKKLHQHSTYVAPRAQESSASIIQQ
ncbi:Uncharacterized protein M6B38_227165 [Iris pallida]|uniref:Uncharacterized protein n=1 Tax=Iris pallida TaxID=29817 RepID=A0AAX6DTP7_IRIPA|nr:Uncharacterized protein M6B38_227165 [Iris pallida]